MLSATKRSSSTEYQRRWPSLDLAVEGLSGYSPVDPDRPALVIGYGTPPAYALPAAVARLVEALAGR